MTGPRPRRCLRNQDYYSEPLEYTQALVSSLVSPCWPYCLTASGHCVCRPVGGPARRRLWALLVALEVRARPTHPGDGATRGRQAVVERYGCPGALEQRLGDEEPETHPVRLAIAQRAVAVACGTRRDVWLTQCVEDQGPDPRAIVRTRAAAPARSPC